MVSVIIPIYNTEKFLPKCIDSVLGQTYKNLEIILVNDGSPDKSLPICREYEKKDNRIIVVDKPNGGLSDARNHGTAAATGRYIFYLDSDDFIADNALEILVDKIEETNTDMVIFNFQRFKYNADYSINLYEAPEVKLPCGVFNKKEVLNMFSIVTPPLVTAWSKLYKTSVAKAVNFPKGKINEDEFTAHVFINNCELISIIDTPLYFYQNNPNSIINSKNLISCDKLFAIYDRILFLQNLDLSAAENVQIHVFYLHFRNIFPYLYKAKSKNINEIFSMYKTLYKKLINLQDITIYDKIKMLCMRYIPKTYSFIYNIIFKN